MAFRRIASSLFYSPKSHPHPEVNCARWGSIFGITSEKIVRFNLTAVKGQHKLNYKDAARVSSVPDFARGAEDLATATLLGAAFASRRTFLNGSPITGSPCSGSSRLESQLLTSCVRLQRVALLDVASQELLGEHCHGCLSISSSEFLAAKSEVNYSLKHTSVVNGTHPHNA